MARQTIKNPTLQPSPPFGDVVMLPELPPGTDMILVCVDLYQSKPVQLMLTHQLYYDTVRQLVEEHGCRSISIMPMNSEHWITLDAEPFK